MTPLPPIKVSRPNGVHKPWIIKDDHGLVDLRFTPLADVANHINLGLIAIKYQGPAGQFSGHIIDANGIAVSFDRFIGMGEKKYIRM